LLDLYIKKKTWSSVFAEYVVSIEDIKKVKNKLIYKYIKIYLKTFYEISPFDFAIHQLVYFIDVFACSFLYIVSPPSSWSVFKIFRLSS